MKSVSSFLLFTILFFSYQSTIYQVARRFTVKLTGGTVMYYSPNDGDFVEEELVFNDTQIENHDVLTLSFVGTVYDKYEFDIGEYSEGQSGDRVVFKHKKENLNGTFTLGSGDYEYSIEGIDTRNYSRSRFTKLISLTQITYRDPYNAYKITLDIDDVILHVKQFTFAMDREMFTSIERGIIGDYQDELSETETEISSSSQTNSSLNSIESQQSMNSITNPKDLGIDHERMLRSKSKITKQVLSELGEYFGKLTQDPL
jgi:hypothetical protein